MGRMSARAMWSVAAASGAMLIGFAAFAGLPAMRSSEARPAIPAYGNIIQSGALTGWASGARISSHDSAVVEFEQIAHARQLAQRDVFEYGGLKLRVAQVFQVDYQPAAESPAGRGARPDMTLLRVTARIQPAR
jgi:hypothetical protein